MNTNLTTAQLFSMLNDYRAKLSMSPLKSWKESRAKLEAAVSALGVKVNFEAPLSEIQKQTIRPVDQTSTVNTIPAAGGDTSTDVGTSKPEKTAALKQARVTNAAKDAALEKMEKAQPSTSAKQTPSQKATKKAIEKNVVKKATKSQDGSAASILAELGIDPKQGRALLRKHNVDRTADAIKAFFKARAK